MLIEKAEKIHKREIHHIEFSKDGEYLMTGSVDGSAKIWDFRGEAYLKEKTLQMESRILYHI
jgi:WD40 repeat protein